MIALEWNYVNIAGGTSYLIRFVKILNSASRTGLFILTNLFTPGIWLNDQ